MHESLMPNHDLIHSSAQMYYMLASVVLLIYDLVTTLDIEIMRRGKLQLVLTLDDAGGDKALMVQHQPNISHLSMAP